MKLRSKHSETIQQLKSQFLRDKRDYQQDSENKIATLERKANKVILLITFPTLCKSAAGDFENIFTKMFEIF